MIAVIKRWMQRRRTRAATLSTSGVTPLVVRVMDRRYGKHNWRVDDGMLMALVRTNGQGHPWWGLIGSLSSPYLTTWLMSMDEDAYKPEESK